MFAHDNGYFFCVEILYGRRKHDRAPVAQNLEGRREKEGGGNATAPQPPRILKSEEKRGRRKCHGALAAQNLEERREKEANSFRYGKKAEKDEKTC